jgi:hypothetical protein
VERDDIPLPKRQNSVAMAEFGILDRLRDLFASRRFVWILTISLAVLVALYLLFVTLFFNPFEAKLVDSATIVPSQVDYFVRWREAGSQFGEFPTPAMWSSVEDSSAFDEVQSSGALTAIGDSSGLGGVLEQLGTLSAYLPIGLSLKDDLLQEVAVAGNGTLRFDSGFEGMIMLRGSFKVKAGVSMLGFGFVRDKLPEGVQIEDIGSGLYRLPQFEAFGFQDAYLGRVKDMILLSSRRELIDVAKDLDQRSGQDSLAQSSNFHDNVIAWLGPGERPLEVFLRWDTAQKQFGTFPNPESDGLVSRFLRRFFTTDMLRFAAGYWKLEKEMELRLSGDLDYALGDDFQKSWLEGSPVGAQRLKDYADMVPASSFAFAAIAGDPVDLMLELYDLTPEDLRQSMDRGVADSGQYQGMVSFLREIGGIYKPGMAVALRPNTYPPDEDSPENDGAPVPLFAVIGKVRNMGAYERVYEYLRANWANFTGRSGEQSVQTVTFGGGAKGTSFVSRLIPGTGEIMVLQIPTLEMVIVTNSALYANDIINVAFLDKKQPRAKRDKLLLQPSFEEAMDKNRNGAHFFLWASPKAARPWLEPLSIGDAENALKLEREAAWRSRRPQLEKQLRQSMFEGRTALNPSEEAQLLEAIDDALLKEDSTASSRLSELVEIQRKGWLPSQLLESMHCGFRVSRRSAEMVLGATVAD